MKGDYYCVIKNNVDYTVECISQHYVYFCGQISMRIAVFDENFELSPVELRTDKLNKLLHGNGSW